MHIMGTFGIPHPEGNGLISEGHTIGLDCWVLPPDTVVVIGVNADGPMRSPTWSWTGTQGASGLRTLGMDFAHENRPFGIELAPTASAQIRAVNSQN